MIPAVLALVITLIARIVPRVGRAQWREEWLAELEQITVHRGVSAAARMALGSVRDAMALRQVTRARGSQTTAVGWIGSMRPGITWLDFKLALRMLARYPGLTAIGVVSLAVGMAICAGAFAVLYGFMDPALPLDEGDKIITIQNMDVTRNRPDRRTAHDFAAWREALVTVQDLGAFRQVGRNLIAPGAQPETVRVAEISASAFRVTRVQPLMGRYLADDDERAGAAPVLVIGYDTWTTRFGSDPTIVGQEVQLGDTRRTIVGVMPLGYAFPINHSFWVPLRLDLTRYQPGLGPDITVFGRLVDGETYESAQAELTTAGQRTTTEFPRSHQHLRPQISPYTFPFFDMHEPGTAWIAHLAQFLISLLLVVVCVNVAILVYARTARRHGEIAIRTALGASRRRIVGQLFVEALALAVAASIAGLAATAVGLRYINEAMSQSFAALPFWWTFRLTPGVVAYSAVLTVLAAAIVGVVPALKATGRHVHAGLQSISSGGGSGMRLGRTWTVLIVAQVAFAVALLPAAVFHAWDSLRTGTASPGFEAEAFLSTQVMLDPGSGVPADPAAQAVRSAGRLLELQRLIAAEPGISDLTVAMAMPGAEATVVIEADGVPLPSNPVTYNIREGTTAGYLARFNKVDAGFFATFGVPLLTGRGLTPADAAPGATAIVVNRAFAQQILGDRDVLGRRVRYVGRSGDAAPGSVRLNEWYEVVGVVADFPNVTESGLAPVKLYHAAKPGDPALGTLLFRVAGGDAMAFSGRLREIAAAVDPNLQLRDVVTIDQSLRREQEMMRIVAVVLSVLTAAVLLLSSAGIYAMMSFTVAQRRKEIGIRAALGADPRRILAGIFTRAFAQLSAGALLGGITAVLLDELTGGELMKGKASAVLPIVAILMVVVGLLAALGPARRGLRIHPTEALREP